MGAAQAHAVPGFYVEGGDHRAMRAVVVGDLVRYADRAGVIAVNMPRRRRTRKCNGSGLNFAVLPKRSWQSTGFCRLLGMLPEQIPEDADLRTRNCAPVT
jgi:hypothetical protein